MVGTSNYELNSSFDKKKFKMKENQLFIIQEINAFLGFDSVRY